MNILFVTLSPLDSIYSCSIRNEALMKGLLDIGCSIYVVSVHNSTGLSRKTIFDSESDVIVYYVDLIGKNGSIRKAKQKNGRFIKVLRKVYHMFFIFEHSSVSDELVINSDVLGREYDYVISSSDPKISHVIARKIIKKLNQKPKWIQYWGDPLADDITNKTIYPFAFRSKVEERIIREADKIVYTSPFTLKRQVELYPEQSEKMVALPTPYLKKCYFARVNKDVCVIGYHGNFHSKYRNISPLVQAVESLGASYRLDLIGATDLVLSNSDNVVFKGQVEDIDLYQKESDLLVVLLNRFGTQIPGKLYHIAGINRPILVIVDGEHKSSMKEYVMSFRRYYVCENETQAIIDEMLKIKEVNFAVPSQELLSAPAIATEFIRI